ncbi:hypothetical protein Taro_027010 [Colocasia esculenta]|uniref:Uncharacterized protein n=1 Tax=Colocasia esculenta TaxID=4460 RepID=A0A843VGU5_COLES|nr:hypothetical protein [Colocasia esculenta]
MIFLFKRVSSVGCICQPNCTAGSLFGIAAEVGDAILNASSLPDVILGIASVARGVGFCLASDRGDAFNEVKRSVCPIHNLQKAEEALSGAREELLWLLRWISGDSYFRMACAAQELREDDARSVGVPSARRFWHASASSAGETEEDIDTHEDGDDQE